MQNEKLFKSLIVPTAFSFFDEPRIGVHTVNLLRQVHEDELKILDPNSEWDLP